MFNAVQFYEFGKSRNDITNTFIGGVSSTIGTAQLLATKLAINASRITAFSVLGTDIKCKITGVYVIPNSCFINNTLIKNYYDNDNLITSIGSSSFSGAANFEDYKFNGVTSLNGTFCFSSTNLQIINLPNCISISNFALNGFKVFDAVIYIPKVTTLGTSAANNSVFDPSIFAGTTVYASPNLATNNGGNPDGDLAYVTANGGVVRYVTNYNIPNNVTNLTSGTIYNSSIQLNFTAPNSTNVIDYYECYVNGVYYSKIKQPGKPLIGLSPSTSYTISLYVVDVFYNKSIVSNTLIASTNSTSAIPLTGLVSYYKFEEKQGTIAYDSYGNANLTNNNNVLFRQDGIVGLSYASVAVNRSLSATGITAITGKFSINVWCFRTGNSSANSNIIMHGDFGNGFGIWIDSTAKITWFINSNFNNYSSLVVLPLNTWSMITLVYNQTNIKIYQNSVLKVTTAITTNPNSVTTRRLFNRSSGNDGFIGRLDEASFYNTEITQSNIDQLYNNGNGTTL